MHMISALHLSKKNWQVQTRCTTALRWNGCPGLEHQPSVGPECMHAEQQSHCNEGRASAIVSTAELLVQDTSR